MDRDGTKYEKVPQREEPEAAVGAGNDNGAHAVAHEDNQENSWPIYKGRENTALALTQLDLDNGIEMMVNELREMANIGEEVLRHGAPDITPSEISVHSHETDESIQNRKSTTNESPTMNEQGRRSLSSEEQQATPGAESQCSTQSNPERGIQISETTQSDTMTCGDKIIRITAELSKLFDHTSEALKALAVDSQTRERPLLVSQERERPKLPSGCQVPCMTHSLKWLEERVVVLDAVLGPMQSRVWMGMAKLWETNCNESASSQYPHDEVVWFKKRVSLLCCCYDDIQALGKEGEGREAREKNEQFGRKQNAKSLQQRVRTNILGNVLYREMVVWELLNLAWHHKEKTLSVFRLALVCIMAVGCAFTSDIDITVGQFLELAFSEEILPRPDTSDTLSWARYVLLTIAMVTAISRRQKINRASLEDLVIEWSSDDQGREKDLLLTFSSLFVEYEGYDLLMEKAPNFSDVQDVESTAGIPRSTKFDVNDMDIKSLKRLGDIHVEWTNTFVDHLRLELGDRNILHVCWMAHFPGYNPIHWNTAGHGKSVSAVATSYLLATHWHMIAWPRTMISPSLTTAICTRGDIERSWAFLFREGVQSAAYRGLEAPIFIKKPTISRAQRWLRAFMGRSTPQLEEPRNISMKSLMSTPTASDSFPEVKMHAGLNPFTNKESQYSRMVREAIERNKQLDYRDFWVYRERIRILREYMDDRKPRDFWGLVYDRRNTLQYYTFWSVIAVGLLSILLGLMSLAVGIAQAVFAYRALNLPVAATTTKPIT